MTFLYLQFKEYGDVETVRLRSAARPDLKTTKRTAVITRNIHENRNNINAYVRFKVSLLVILGSCLIRRLIRAGFVVDLKIKPKEAKTQEISNLKNKLQPLELCRKRSTNFLTAILFSVEETHKKLPLFQRRTKSVPSRAVSLMGPSSTPTSSELTWP